MDPIHWIPPELGSSFEIHSEEGFAGIEQRIRREMRGQQLLSASLSNLNTGNVVDGSVRVVNPQEMIIGRPYIIIKCPFLQPIINRDYSISAKIQLRN